MSDSDLSEGLHARREHAFLVPLKTAEGAQYNECHENAEAYVLRHAACEVVRGWLIEDFVGFTYFNAHSVVRDTLGYLFDPTPMRQHCPFILHEGDDEDFAVQRRNRPRVQYPVLESDRDALSAPSDEGETLDA